MATSKKYHLMLRSGQTYGKTGEDKAQLYRYSRYEIIEAPATEFDHLGADVKTFDKKEDVEKARQNALEK